MSKITSFLFLFFGIAAFSQVAIDTAQIVVPNRINNLEAKKKPYVIMISADGFRPDYTKKYEAENLLKFSESGVEASAMNPSYPSITFPNHWSLITGLYPAHHGLIDNIFYDYKRKEGYSISKKETTVDGSWYGGIPLWALAGKQGVVSASLQWVGSASNAGNFRPAYYYPYHEKFSPNEKVEKVVNWLKMPEEVRPHFITLYFPEVDASGHHFGPDSKETQSAVQKIDEAIGNLVKKVGDLQLENVNYIFVSDHGMIKVEGDTPLEIPEMLLNKDRFDYYNSQSLLRVYVKNETEVKEVYKELQSNKDENYTVYLTKKMPKYLHFSSKEDRYNRIGQITLIPKSPKIFLEKGKKTSVGKHGYDPKIVPEMKATFYAWGPAFKNSLKINEFSNVNVYPLVAEILGLNIEEPIDGNLKVLKKILKDK
ncbi:ectonucleotide pyrophosphatase/phosphodiesterase [Chryseobacterium sp.]|uniref:alkaline phosphatase family protein n=1 Tax=Chryseobacterium sp. TaxID=1871047 RepID=UPI003890CA3E